MNEILIRKAKKGDKDAFCRLIDENVQSMYKVAAAYLKNDEDVADAIQDTILSCYENLKSLKQNRYFKTWMIRILINKCKDMIQKKKLVTYTDQMPETPFHEEKYTAMEWIQALEPLDSKYRLEISMSLRLRNALNFSIDYFLLFLLCIEGCIYIYIRFSHYSHIHGVNQVVL